MARSLFAFAAVCALAASPASAHHGPGPVDLRQEVMIVGTIVEAEWKNPHVLFTLQTTDADGAPLLQQVEADGVSALQTSGLTRQMLAPGAAVEVRAHPNRQGPGRKVLGIDVTTADGAVYPLVPVGARATARPPTVVAADSIAGRWAPTPEAHLAAGAQLYSSTLTAAGGERLEALARSYMGGSGCEPMPTPLQMTFHVLRTVEVRPDTVVIAVDFGQRADERVVRLDEEQPPGGREPTREGYSTGRWDGDALLIETTGLIALGPAGRVVERLSLTEDRLRIRYEIAIEDPDTFKEPVSATELWEHRPDLAPAAEACDPAIAGALADEMPALPLAPLGPPSSE